MLKNIQTKIICIVLKIGDYEIKYLPRGSIPNRVKNSVFTRALLTTHFNEILWLNFR